MPVHEKTWLKIKRACCEGKGYAEVSAAYGVRAVTIRSRASRQKWPTPLKAQRILQQEQRDATKGELSRLVNQMREQAEEATNHAATLLHQKIMALDDVPEIRSHKDLVACLTLLRKAGGLDSAQSRGSVNPAVCINLGALYSPGGGSGETVRVLERQAVRLTEAAE